MFGRKPAIAIAALVLLGLCAPPFTREAAAGAPPGPVRMAQYDGPGFGGLPGYGGPPGYGDPDEGYGPPPGPYGGAGGYEPGPSGRTAAHRRPAKSRRGSVAQHVTYHGFRIDLSEGGSSRNLTGQIASMEHQIDLVDGVGLSLSNLELFRGLPIRISNRLRGGGHYDGGPVVEMGSLAASDRRPVLLHEFMHVYHHARLPRGFRNTDIQAFYSEALRRGLYPAGSYMLSNPGEFFAMTASCYLYGTVARPPYTRDAIRTRQPDYYAYLQRLFGAPHGTRSSGPEQSRAMPRGPGVFGQMGERAVD